MWYISFDCALKSIAFSLVRMDASKLEITSPCTLLQYAAQLRESLFYADGTAEDLAPGRLVKNVPTTEKISLVMVWVRDRVMPSLKQHLNELPDDLTILVERQPPFNTKSTTVSDVLVSCFIREFIHDEANYELYNARVRYVPALLKNKLSFAGDPESHMDAFRPKYKKQYTARKNHSKYIFRRYSELYEFEMPKVPASMQDDLADSMTQIMGFVKFGKPVDD